jgi:rhamnogalacturonyl hydrolase YesR
MVFSAKEITSNIIKVCDWQLQNLPVSFTRLSNRREKILNNVWMRSALFAGVMAVWQVIKNKKYLKAALKWAEANCWLPGPHPRLTDDHCAGQVYTELYLINKDKKMIQPTQKTFDHMMADSKQGRDEWYWCDALFMEPPVLARLSAATQDRRYLDFMNILWWDTAELLYDWECAIFFRD